MIAFIFGVILGLLAVMCGVLYKTYAHTPAHELKRRARKGDEVAALLYRTVAYGLSTKVLLIVTSVVSLYFSFVLLVVAVSAWLAVPVLLVLGLIGVFFVRSQGGAHPASAWLAVKLSPALAWTAEQLHPLLSTISKGIRRLLPIRVHSGLYEKADLAALLEQQKRQPDNRIASGEIDLLVHALSFGDKTVSDALVPKRVVVDVNVDEAVGPVLMGELHKSGHSRFPVYDGRHDNIVGVLYLHDLIETKQTGVVRGIMHAKVMYVHEDFTLYQTLQAFVKTKQHLFVVVNEFEEYVGIITIEDILERVIGKLIVDEFDQYDDMRAVASAAAKKERTAVQNDGRHAEQHGDATDVPAPTDHTETSETDENRVK